MVALCLLATVLGVMSCAPKEEQALVADGLMTGDPCEPPCWQTLLPGSSTQGEVIDVLTASQYAGPLSVEPGRSEAVTIVTWRPDRAGWPSRQRNMFQLQDGQLEVMNMYLDSEVTIGQVVGRYGLPDKHTVFLSMSGPIQTVVQLFFQHRGVIVQVSLAQDRPELKPDATVDKVWYFEPAPLAQAIATLEGRKGQPLEGFQLEWLDYWHDWQGYGVVEPDHSYP